jgi:uncharacterized protein
MFYLIFASIGIFTGFLMALFGIGGGAFIVPALDVAFQIAPNSTHPPFQLIVIGSLCTIILGSAPKAFAVLTDKTKSKKIALSLIFSALPFIILASFVATKLTDNHLRLGFSITIVLIGLWTLFGKTPNEKSSGQPIQPKLYQLIFTGALSGISSVLFGLGGATILMPLLTMWVGLPILVCLDLSILFVFITSNVSLVFLTIAWFKLHELGSIALSDVGLVLILGICAAITQIIASKKLNKMNGSVRKILLGCYLIALGIWVTANIYF